MNFPARFLPLFGAALAFVLSAGAADVAPTPVDIKSGHVNAEFWKKQRAWFERTVATPFRERAKGQSWEDGATVFAAAALAAWEPRSAYEMDEDLAARGRALGEQGCHDPLVQILAARLAYRGSYEHFWHWLRLADMTGFQRTDLVAAINVCEPALDALEKSGTARGFLHLLALELAEDCIHANDRARSDRLAQRAADWLREALTDGSYQIPGDEELLVAHVLAEPYWRHANQLPVELRGDLEKAGLSDWARLALLGGCDWTESTQLNKSGQKEKGDALFASARENWSKSWHLRPDVPEPAQLVHHFSWNYGTPDGDLPVEWFRRVVAARFDFRPPYADTVTNLRVDWRGRPGELSAFGRACVATKRFDTGVPLVLPDALRTSVTSADWRPVCRQPEIRAALVALGQGMLAEPLRRDEEPLWRSMLAVWAWLGGDDRAAADALAALPDGRLHTAAFYELRWFCASLDEMRADLAIRLSPAKDDYERGQSDYAAFKLAEAHAAYESALAQAPDDERARAWLRQKLAVTGFEIDLAKGEWMKVPAQLDLWDVREGRWANTADGALTLEGDGHPAQIRFRPRVGVRVEFRGDYGFSAPDDVSRKPELGIAFRFIPGDGFLQCSTWESDAAQITSAVRQGLWHPRIGPSFPVMPSDVTMPQREMNHFRLATDARQAAFELNGQMVFEHMKTTTYTKDTAGLQIGFVAREPAPRNVVAIRNLEIRRLPE